MFKNIADISTRYVVIFALCREQQKKAQGCTTFSVNLEKVRNSKMGRESAETRGKVGEFM